MSWIRFDPDGTSASGKTRVWQVRTGDGLQALGLVLWFAAWRRYVFTPHEGGWFDHGCLRDIADFCETATREHRARRLAAVGAKEANDG